MSECYIRVMPIQPGSGIKPGLYRIERTERGDFSGLPVKRSFDIVEESEIKRRVLDLIGHPSEGIKDYSDVRLNLPDDISIKDVV